MSNSHARQMSVASFASSLYLPVDPDNKPNFDDENEAYPSSDELFGPDHEEGDDYTISSRRYLSSHSRYSSSYSHHTSHPPTPPRTRYGNPDPGLSPLAPMSRPATNITTSVSAALPSPPSTARSSDDNHLSSHMDEIVAPKPDEGVPIEKFDQLVIEHLEQDRALLQTLRRLDVQKNRITQLTYALSRLRVLSNSACLSPEGSNISNAPRSNPPMQFHRLGAVIPKPLIVKPSAYSASSSTLGRSALSTRDNPSGLTGPSLNEAVNQRRRAKQQLHEFALRRPTRSAKGRPIGRFAARADANPNQAKRAGWEGTRGSPSLVPRETKPRAPGIVDHPNVTMRRAKHPGPPRPPTSMTGPLTPPRLAALFYSPSTITSRSPLTPTQNQILSTAVYGSPATPVPSRKNKPLPPRPVSPTKPMKLARNISFNYALPPVPRPHETTAHITFIDSAETAPALPVEEVQNRLAATFAHFAKPRALSPLPRPPSPPRRALDMTSPDQGQPDYLEELLRKKWIEQLDEHAHQARGNWKSPLKSIKQRITGGFGLARRSSRASFGDSSSDTHTHPNMSMDGGYVHGLDTLEEGGAMDQEDSVGAGKLPPVVDHHKLKKPKKKGTLKDDEVHPPPSAATPSVAASSSKPHKSAWRFSRS
ncbi:hypothetical protein FRC10_011627 [Ceratobasidium sp. 414]|nr:hypothetical protein FRC10_011627 [Ceratobasidium sp. 414]